jgi:APA family basic amino acid/polyamine antiporter
LSLNPVVQDFDFGQLLIGMGVALVAVSWAFDGWHNINYVAGEIKNPKRNLPMALVLGTFIITGLYILMNFIYIKALPIQEMQGVVRIGEKATTTLFGNTTASLVSAAVLISIFGALNGAIFVAPRVYYAMAKDGLFFQRVATVHPRFRTPSFAILLQAVWASLLALSGTYEQLFTYVIFITFIFWIAGTASVFRLRKKYPDLPRPYKTWGYPIMPIIFIIMSLGIVLNTLIQRPVESLAGVGLTLIGIPVYFYWQKKRSLPRPDGTRIDTDGTDKNG